MQRYQRSVQAFDDAVGRRLGLGPADLRCLDWLADGPKSAGQLAVATALTPAATTALVDRLVRKGFVERYRSDEDRRQVMVRMTPTRDEPDHASSTGRWSRRVRRCSAGFSDRELRLMSRHLEAITELTDRHRTRVDEGSEQP